MRVLVQRVRQGWVEWDKASTPPIGLGLVALVGFCRGDTPRMLAPMARKMVELRIFPDETGRMNRSLGDLNLSGEGGGLVLVPQFTLYADCRKGRRPGFFDSLEPGAASGLFDRFAAACREMCPRVEAGKFGADMRVHLTNDGPVTIWLDSRELGLDEPAGSEGPA
ncbi:MAG: D-aminoacyl-tRNA deacylase [Deltaproteobacteria bacterium]|nr:D-aminoacyl-tRNA deacylase [Deltaproteobacteria bacterium]